uniref:YTH domain-containing family protein n=1 Tax=Solanum tuberosum TaxID=4113 RepID=M1AXP6_SOLTU
MPSDTARENASIANSIVTDCKNERRNFDGPDSSRLGVNEDTNRSIAEELTVSSPPFGISSAIENDSSCLGVNEDTNRSIAEELTVSSPPIGISSVIEKGKLYSIRYFVIKSLNHENIQLSVSRGIWATQAMNEAILDEAFHELPPDIGEALCELLDGQDALDVDLKMDIFARNNLSFKRPYVEPSLHLGDQDCNASLIPNGTMFYPSLLYQHQIDASRLHVAPQRIKWCIFC